MLVENDNFTAICHVNKIVYSFHPSVHFTPKAGHRLHNKIVPLLYKHMHNDPNAVIGYAVLKWCSDTCEIHAECYTNVDARKYLVEGQPYSLDAMLTDIKYTHTGNMREYSIREVSLIPHELIPEHEEIIFKFSKDVKVRPTAEIKFDFGCDGRDSHYYISYTCPKCKRIIYKSDKKCKDCDTVFDWSKKAYIEYTRHIEWRE